MARLLLRGGYESRRVSSRARRACILRRPAEDSAFVKSLLGAVHCGPSRGVTVLEDVAVTEHEIIDNIEIGGGPAFNGMRDVIPDGSDVCRIAQRIRHRDHELKSCAHAQWLENGRDLLEAKRILGHGKFNEWCKRELQYSIRTAQKLMRAAEVCGPLIKCEPDSGLPLPTAVYAVSAPSVPRDIREAYAPRIVAGESVLAELRKAIKLHREQVNSSKSEIASRAAKSPEAQEAQYPEAAEAHRDPREAQQLAAEQVQRESARSEALALIQASFGDNLPDLIALVAKAGPGSIFGIDAERELLKQVQLSEAPPTDAENGCDADQAVAAADNILSPNEGDALSSPSATMVDEPRVEQAPAAKLGNVAASAMPGMVADPPNAVTTSFISRKQGAQVVQSRSRAPIRPKPEAPLGRPTNSSD